MLIGRQNPRGGPRLSPGSFPLHEDLRTKEFGYLIGYLEDGEKVLVSISLAEDFANCFGSQVSLYRQMMGRLGTRTPLKQRLFMMMFGKRAYHRLVSQYERGELD